MQCGEKWRVLSLFTSVALSSLPAGRKSANIRRAATKKGRERERKSASCEATVFSGGGEVWSTREGNSSFDNGDARLKIRRFSFSFFPLLSCINRNGICRGEEEGRGELLGE